MQLMFVFENSHAVLLTLFSKNVLEGRADLGDSSHVHS